MLVIPIIDWVDRRRLVSELWWCDLPWLRWFIRLRRLQGSKIVAAKLGDIVHFMPFCEVIYSSDVSDKCRQLRRETGLSVVNCAASNSRRIRSGVIGIVQEVVWALYFRIDTAHDGFYTGGKLAESFEAISFDMLSSVLVLRPGRNILVLGSLGGDWDISVPLKLGESVLSTD